MEQDPLSQGEMQGKCRVSGSAVSGTRGLSSELYWNDGSCNRGKNRLSMWFLEQSKLQITQMMNEKSRSQVMTIYVFTINVRF